MDADDAESLLFVKDFVALQLATPPGTAMTSLVQVVSQSLPQRVAQQCVLHIGRAFTFDCVYGCAIV